MSARAERAVVVLEHAGGDASTIVTWEGKGFWISTTRLPWDGKRFETLVFPHPLTTLDELRQVKEPEIAQYNTTNIEGVELARENHGQAVQAAIGVLQARGQ